MSEEVPEWLIKEIEIREKEFFLKLALENILKIRKSYIVRSTGTIWDRGDIEEILEGIKEGRYLINDDLDLVDVHFEMYDYGDNEESVKVPILRWIYDKYRGLVFDTYGVHASFRGFMRWVTIQLLRGLDSWEKSVLKRGYKVIMTSDEVKDVLHRFEYPEG